VSLGSVVGRASVILVLPTGNLASASAIVVEDLSSVLPKLVGLFSSHGHSREATEDPLSLLTACSMSAATALGCEK
jgi:hypothetical protein